MRDNSSFVVVAMPPRRKSGEAPLKKLKSEASLEDCFAGKLPLTRSFTTWLYDPRSFWISSVMGEVISFYPCHGFICFPSRQNTLEKHETIPKFMHNKFPDEACPVCADISHFPLCFLFWEQVSIIKFLRFLDTEFPAPEGVSEAQKV